MFQPQPPWEVRSPTPISFFFYFFFIFKQLFLKFVSKSDVVLFICDFSLLVLRVKIGQNDQLAGDDITKLKT
jgi:hypothetical protein